MPTPFDALIDTYAEGPALLRKAVAGMTDIQLRARPVAGKWSTLEVLCHLGDFEIVCADRIKRVIVEDRPTMFGGDPERFAARLSYDVRDADEELRLIETIRSQVTRILRTLGPDDLTRVGVHTEAGPMTLEALVGRVAAHIPHHIPFIEAKRRAMA